MQSIAISTAPYSTENEWTWEEIVDYSEWTDEELIQEYRTTGRRALFEVLVQRYERELFNYLCRYLGNAENAEDVFQTTFMQIHLKCDQFEDGRKFRPWLYRIATNQAIDLHRKTKRYQVISLDENRGSGGEPAFTPLPGSGGRVYSSSAASAFPGPRRLPCSGRKDRTGAADPCACEWPDSRN